MGLPQFQQAETTPTMFDGSQPYAKPAAESKTADAGEPSEKVTSEEIVDKAETLEADASEKGATDADDSEYSELIDRHGKDPKKLAKSLSNAEQQVRKLQSRFDRRDAEHKALLDLIKQTAEQDGAEPTKAEIKEAKRAAAKFFEDADEADKLVEELSGTPAQRLKALKSLRAAMKDELRAEIGDELRNEVRSEHKQETTQRIQEDAKQHNLRLYHDRSKEILFEREQAKGKSADQKLIARYSDPKRELTRDELQEAYEQLQDEFDVMERELAIPRDGKWTMEHFRKVAMLRDPDEYRNKIERETRAKTLADMKRSSNGVKRIETGSRLHPDVDAEAITDLPDDANAVHQLLAGNPALARRVMLANKRG